MAEQQQLGRWLFLEQKSHATEWGANRDNWGLLATSTRVDLLKVRTPLPDQDTAIVICFLEADGEARVFEGIPKAPKEGSWKVWCHYGNDIHSTGGRSAKNRWQTWRALSEKSRDTITEANGGVHPHHYSSTQVLPWSKEINSVKRLIKGTINQNEGELKQGQWEEIHRYLDTAWKKASGHVAVAVLMQALNRSLPDLMASGTIRNALPQGETTAYAHETGRQILALFNQSGFGQTDELYGQEIDPKGGEHDPSVLRLKSAFEKAWFVRSDLLELLRTWEKAPSENDAEIRGKHELLLRRLIEHALPLDFAWLDAEYRDLSKIVTAQLSANPHTVGGRR